MNIKIESEKIPQKIPVYRHESNYPQYKDFSIDVRVENKDGSVDNYHSTFTSLSRRFSGKLILVKDEEVNHE